MKNLLNKLFQALMDISIGAFVYFYLQAFHFELGFNLTAMIALAVTSIVAETIEFRFKFGKKGGFEQ